MGDAGSMRALGSARDLPGQAGGFIRRNRPSCEPRSQRLAVDERHRQERASVRQLLDVVDSADVRVVQRRRGTSLGKQPASGIVVAHELRGQELQRDGPVQACVRRAVDDPHPPAAEAFADPVLGDDAPRVLVGAGIGSAIRVGRVGARGHELRRSRSGCPRDLPKEVFGERRARDE
jgi:hypothetical protein